MTHTMSRHTKILGDVLLNQRSNATAGATLTLEEFMQALLTAISRYNLHGDMRRLRTRVMLEANVPPVPKHMFLFNMAMRAGDAAWELTEEMIIRRLAKRIDTLAPGGIVSLNKRVFTSTPLQNRAVEYEALNNGRSMPFVGYETFTSKLHLLWDDDGILEELEADDPTLAKFGIAIPDVRDYIQMRDGADLAEERDRNRWHPTVEQSVKKGAVSKTTQRRMEAVEGLRRTVNNRRARKMAEAHAGAAHTRAVLNAAQSKSALVRETPPASAVATDCSVEGAQEIDIDF